MLDIYDCPCKKIIQADLMGIIENPYIAASNSVNGGFSSTSALTLWHLKIGTFGS